MEACKYLEMLKSGLCNMGYITIPYPEAHFNLSVF